MERFKDRLTVSENNSLPFTEGFNAYASGEPFDWNPYIQNLQAEKDWERGWLEGYRKQNEEK